MRFLSPSECGPILASTHLKVSERGHLANREFTFDGIRRLAGGPNQDVDRLGDFVQALIRWLPKDRGRLLWISGTNTGSGNALEALKAMRVGLGERRALAASPGHYVGPFSWSWDQSEITRDQAAQTEILAGMLFIVMGCGWDGWLAAEQCADLIEFWEGNLLFYSMSPERINEARALQRQFGCREMMR